MITGDQLHAFCTDAIAHIRTGAEIEPSLWLLLESGDTVVVPGTDYEHYDDHSEWPVLLMTGPDPEWLLQWWMDDVTTGGDEWVEQRATALQRARDASDEDWLKACQRAVDQQLAPIAATQNDDTTATPPGGIT